LRQCRHCVKRKAHAARGLCSSCWTDEAIRNQYPPKVRSGRKGVGIVKGKRPVPEPTVAYPGTAEKVQVLEERARRGEQLFHPLDTPLDLR
jgi:hypothetical protein